MTGANERPGIHLAEAAIAIVSMRGGEGSIFELTAALDHLDGTKAELKEALAYAAAQVFAYRNIANQDAALAIQNIESIVTDYRSSA